MVLLLVSSFAFPRSGGLQLGAPLRLMLFRGRALTPSALVAHSTPHSAPSINLLNSLSTRSYHALFLPLQRSGHLHYSSDLAAGCGNRSEHLARVEARLWKSLNSQHRFESVLRRAERDGINATLLGAQEHRRDMKAPESITSASGGGNNRRRIDPVASADVARLGQSTGAFHAMLPDVFEGPTHFRRAQRSLPPLRLDEMEPNVRTRHRKYAAKSLDALMKALNAPLTEALTAYGVTLRNLHPYEATVANLTVISRCKQGLPHLNDILARVRALRSTSSTVAKEHAAQASRAVSAGAALECLEVGREALKAIYAEGSRALRRVPSVRTDLPTCVLVGCPNVGKSSIVRAVSSGTPEVNNYPFTTRGVSIGHITNPDSDDKLQVMDTPGLLDRPEADRNEMELLTYASMAHLPTAVMFVIDPTGMAGDDKSGLTAQLRVREALRRRFPRRPWMDVVTKSDLPVPPEAAAALPPDALRVSVASGENVPELRARLRQILLVDLPSRLGQRRRQAQDTLQGEGGASRA